MYSSNELFKKYNCPRGGCGQKFSTDWYCYKSESYEKWIFHWREQPSPNKLKTCRYQNYFSCRHQLWTAKLLLKVVRSSNYLNFNHTPPFYPFDFWSPLKGSTYLNKHASFSCRFFSVCMAFYRTPGIKRLSIHTRLQFYSAFSIPSSPTPFLLHMRSIPILYLTIITKPVIWNKIWKANKDFVDLSSQIFTYYYYYYYLY